MTQPVEQLYAQALRLPDKDRGELAAKLIESLDPALDEEIDSAWSEEIRARVEELQQGRAQTVPWPEARRMILEDVDE